jgi:hypothetical protein
MRRLAGADEFPPHRDSGRKKARRLLDPWVEVRMTSATAWWHRPWVVLVEDFLGHVAAVIIGFVLMIVGLALGITMIMLPVGVVVGLVGAALFVSGLFAHVNSRS